MNFSFIQKDVNKILTEIGRDVILRKVTKTVDRYGQTTAVSTADTTIRGWISTVTYEDQSLVQEGWIAGSEAVGIFLDTTIAPHDLIIDETRTYEVVDILSKPRVKDSKPFIKVRLKLV